MKIDSNNVEKVLKHLDRSIWFVRFLVALTYISGFLIYLVHGGVPGWLLSMMRDAWKIVVVSEFATYKVKKE